MTSPTISYQYGYQKDDEGHKEELPPEWDRCLRPSLMRTWRDAKVVP